MRRDLSALFDPVSVAVVGASDDPAKWGHWLAKGALSGPRPVYLVNARADTVLDRPAYRSVRDIPGEVGLAVIAVPAQHMDRAVDDALARGATAIVGISAGLGEAGEEGARRQRAMAQRVVDAGAVMLGPNCLGVVDWTSGLTLTSNTPQAGRVAFVSQSGNLSIELSNFLAEHGLGFSRFASLGNQAQLDAADLVAGCIDHEGTDAIAVYCEDFRDGRRLVAAAREARDAGKPVVLLTVGSSEAAARQAQSHTGSMVSSSAVVDAACAAAGIVRVHTTQEMADVLAVFAAASRPTGRRVGVLTDGGGHASIAADVADLAGLEVPHFEPELAAQVAAHLPPAAASVNPVDVAGKGEQDIDCFARVAEVVLGSGAVDALVLSGYYGGYGLYADEMAAPEVAVAHRLAEIARGTGHPLVVHSMFPRSKAAEALRAEGVPVFRTVEGAVRGLAAALPPTETRALPELPMPRPPITDTDYWGSRALLADSGVPFSAARLVRCRDDVVAAAAQLEFPVVLKSLGLLHKSDLGGVVLGLPDADALLAAYDQMQVRLAPVACTVEEMADLSDGVELIVGVRQDPRFGPVAMVGLGGIYTEVMHDVESALAPLDAVTAQRMLRRLRGAALLAGARGRPPVDVAAAAAVVARVTEVAAAQPDLVDVEVNPLLVTPGGTDAFGRARPGAIALDARVIPGRRPRST